MNTMSATNAQIVELAKRGFDGEQIEKALNLPVGSAAYVLAKDDAAMKAVEKDKLEGSFANLEECAFAALEHVIKYAENESVRNNAAQFLLKQRLGVFKPRERLTVTNNIQFLMDRADKAKALKEQTTIDV